MSRHALNTYHPALARLLRDQSRASLRRLRRHLASRRRLVLSCLAVVLSLLWLGNAALSILFRESADPDHLRHWVPLGLLAYAVWHVVKVGYRRPEHAIEWSTAEREILTAAPFARGQLLTYRLASVVGASVMKAGLFVLLMLPDLPRPLFGFVGILLALLLIELWRMTVEMTACGVSQVTYRKLRVADLVCAATAGLSTLVIAGCTPAVATGDGWPMPLLILVRLGQAAVRLTEAPIGQLLLAPFRPFAAVLLAQDMTVGLAFNGLVAVTLVVALAGVVFVADRYFVHRRSARERQAYARRPAGETLVADRQARGRQPGPPPEGLLVHQQQRARAVVDPQRDRAGSLEQSPCDAARQTPCRSRTRRRRRGFRPPACAARCRCSLLERSPYEFRLMSLT